MNDMTQQPVALEPGQQWRHHDGSPWESLKLIAVVRDVKAGWVRYDIPHVADDQRSTEEFFRTYYNVQVLA